MREPSPRSSRLAILGGIAAAAAVGGAGFLLGRAAAPVVASGPVPVATATPVAAPSPSPTAAAAPTVLGRGELLALAREAADAFASGAAMPGAVADAAGRRFDMALPFGCSGQNDPASTAMGWRYDAVSGTLRVSAMPVTWSGADWNVRGTDEAASATGFWINRPWSSAERCPSGTGEAAPTGTDPVTLPGQTLAMAAFGTGDPLGREGRGFETVQRVPEFDGAGGFRLRVTGRLTRDPVRCVQPAGIEQRPICALSAAMEEVRIENAATGAVLATWTIGRPA